ncbi:MAG: ABC transporter ATP-binding protein, partial [Gemmataceae bacterium]|nr:ABC transporter ATP-binding protein [Gemmataceae bacterium]
GVERSQRNQRIDYCMERCHVREVRDRRLGTLSKGYRQRVGLADALLADPPILILDEPTSGLDPVQIGETLNTIKELGGRHTVLLSTHILSEVEKVCERVIIIDKGRIKLDESLRRIAERRPVYLLEVRGPRPEVATLFYERSDLKVLASRALEPDLTAFELSSVDGKDPREELSRQIISRGWALRRLEMQRVSLEALFAEVVLRQGATGQNSSATPPSSDQQPPGQPAVQRGSVVSA